MMPLSSTHPRLRAALIALALLTACGPTEATVEEDEPELDADLNLAVASQGLNPTADATVSASDPAANYGALSSLRAAGAGKEAHLKFAIPDGPAISKATLRLYVVGPSVNAADLHRVASTSWNETKLSWSTRPTAGARVGTLTTAVAGQWVEFDVTAAVKRNSTVGFVLRGRSGDGVSFASRESSAKPSLVLESTQPTPPPSTNCSPKNATLKTYEDFEVYPFVAVKEHAYPGSTISRTTAMARAGRGAFRAIVGSPQLTPAQCSVKRYRAEVFAKDLSLPWDDGKSYWWGVSFNPVDFPGEVYTLLQLHAPNPASATNCVYSGNSFSVYARNTNGKLSYQLAVMENGGRSDGHGAGSNNKVVWSEPLKTKAWTDFVFNFTLSSKGKGYLRVWRNGQPIYSRSGLTNVNHTDSCGAPLPADKRSSRGPHVGVYGPSCATGDVPSPHYRELLVDELRTAVGPEGYGVVAPACN